MATQPNAGRDIESDILRVLAEADLPLTIREIRDRLPLPVVSASGVRGNLYGSQRRGYVQVDGVGGAGGAYWRLTDEGMRVAEARGRTRRAEG